MREDKYKRNMEQWKLVKKLTKEDHEKLGLSGNGYGVFSCNVCGKERYINITNIKRSLTVCSNGCHGRGSKSSSQTIIGKDDINTTHPHLTKYFVNDEDGYKYKAFSNKHIRVKCPHCNLERDMVVSHLTYYGFSCSMCGGGVSYPERFIFNILKNLNITFSTQFRFDSHPNKKYDFYLTIGEVNYIIEVHGSHHYQTSERYSKWKTYEEKHDNDLLKYDIAVYHGYEYNKNFFILDCRHSSCEWIRNSIENSELKEIIDISKIEWDKVEKESLSSLIKEVCEYWDNKRDISKTAVLFKLGRSTVQKYLRKGAKLGFCNYNGKEEKQKEVDRKSKKIVYVDVDDRVVIKFFDSSNDCSRQISYRQSHISSLARGEGKLHNRHWINSQKLGGMRGFYYIDSDDWENDKHIFKKTIN